MSLDQRSSSIADSQQRLPEGKVLSSEKLWSVQRRSHEMFAVKKKKRIYLPSLYACIGA
jgi:hypothetical protein